MDQRPVIGGSIQNGEVYTFEESAKYLGVSRSALRESRQTKTLYGRSAPKHIRLHYRTVVYRKSTLDDWLNALEEFETGAEANTFLKAG